LRARRQAGRAPGGPRDAVGGGGHNSKPVKVLSREGMREKA
jgi:hypothetical protein